MLKRLVALALVAASMGVAAPGRAAQNCDPNNQPSIQRTEDIAGFAGITGIYAEPEGAPTAVVAMFHGYGNDSRSWVCHVVEAAQHGAIAFALDYRGTTGPFRDTRGWFVSEGADDSIALTQHFLAAHPGIPAISFGISMGGNASGLAVARSDVFDYWFDVEGVANLIEEYILARTVALSGNATAVNATSDIETECGGALEEQPECYRDLTLVTHAEGFAASGLQGAVLVHGLDDGLVPHDQSRQMSTVLRALGIPVEFTTAVLRNDGEPSEEGGTTFTQNIADPLTGGTYPRPLAGHAWEGSDTHIVSATAFARLWTLLDAGTAPSNLELVVNGDWSPY